MFLVRALKVFFVASLLVVLSACGPSQEEKMRIAQQACATIMATRKFESSKRIQVLNEAREEVGDYDYPYPLDDDFLWRSLSLGGTPACIDNIVKPPPPPPKTQAQLEAEAAEAEARAKEAEERRIAEEKAAEEAKRKAEEKEKYIAENTQNTYLYCPSENKEILQRGRQIYEIQPDGNYGYTTIEEVVGGPLKIALIKIAKINGDDSILQSFGIEKKYRTSPVFFDIELKKEPEDSSCYRSAFSIAAEDKSFCLGEGEVSIPQEGIFDASKDYKAEDSELFGNPILIWGSVGYADFVLDRVSLTAADGYNRLSYKGESSYSNYRYECSIVTKETYEEKIQDQIDRLEKAAEEYKATLEEKQSQEVQI